MHDNKCSTVVIFLITLQDIMAHGAERAKQAIEFAKRVLRDVDATSTSVSAFAAAEGQRARAALAVSHTAGADPADELENQRQRENKRLGEQDSVLRKRPRTLMNARCGRCFEGEGESTSDRLDNFEPDAPVSAQCTSEVQCPSCSPTSPCSAHRCPRLPSARSRSLVTVEMYRGMKTLSRDQTLRIMVDECYELETIKCAAMQRLAFARVFCVTDHRGPGVDSERPRFDNVPLDLVVTIAGSTSTQLGSVEVTHRWQRMLCTQLLRTVSPLLGIAMNEGTTSSVECSPHHIECLRHFHPNAYCESQHHRNPDEWTPARTAAQESWGSQYESEDRQASDGIGTASNLSLSTCALGHDADAFSRCTHPRHADVPIEYHILSGDAGWVHVKPDTIRCRAARQELGRLPETDCTTGCYCIRCVVHEMTQEERQRSWTLVQDIVGQLERLQLGMGLRDDGRDLVVTIAGSTYAMLAYTGIQGRPRIMEHAQQYLEHGVHKHTRATALGPMDLEHVFKEFGVPTIDQFAMPWSHVVRRWNCAFPHPDADGYCNSVDSLAANWGGELNWINAASGLLPDIVEKLCVEQSAAAIVITSSCESAAMPLLRTLSTAKLSLRSTGNYGTEYRTAFYVPASPGRPRPRPALVENLTRDMRQNAVYAERRRRAATGYCARLRYTG